MTRWSPAPSQEDVKSGEDVAFTVIVNEASEAVETPSVTPIMMCECVPTSLAAGVPASIPVVALNVAQGGAFLIENMSCVTPLAAFTLGVKLYKDPMVAEEGGDPVIVGRVDVMVEISVDDTEAELPQAASSTRAAETCTARSIGTHCGNTPGHRVTKSLG